MPDLRSIWRPALYHGRGKRPPFFEGWYFKLVDAGEQHRYAVIPGVFIGREPGASHAFVQTLDGVTGRTAYHRYPFEAFQAARDEFDIRVGPNRFRADRIELDIDRPEGRMSGELRFCGRRALAGDADLAGHHGAVRLRALHGVLPRGAQLRSQHRGPALHRRRGATTSPAAAGTSRRTGARRSPRPGSGCRATTSSEAAVGTCLTASVAIIPWLRGAFPGFIVGLWHGGQLYRFATYTGATIERLDLADTHVTWHMTGRTGPRNTPHRLEIVAWRAEGGLLHSPERVVMLQRVLESLTARLDVRLLAVTGGQEQVIFEGTGRHAGLEIVGPIHEIQKLARVT